MNNIPLHEFSDHLSEYDSVAWVPCIAGRLNYKNAPSKTTLGSLQAPRGLNVRVGADANGEKGSRVMAVTSQHNWKDTTNVNASGDFRVMVTGRADSHDDHCVMKLKLGLVPVDFESDLAGPFEAFDALMTAESASKGNAFSALEASLDFDEDNTDQLARGEPVAAGKEKHGEYFLVEALLHPNGLILCRYVDDGFRDPELKAQDNAEYMLQRDTVIRQAYYYLKYVFHQHKHHHAADDCACTVMRIPDDPRHIGPKLVGTLTSSVNQFRRLLDHVGKCDVHHVGVIGYIASLAKSCKRVGFYNDKAYEHQNERLIYVEQSFSAMVKERSFNRITAFQYSTLWLQVATYASLIIGTAYILNKNANEPYSFYYLLSIFGLMFIVSLGMNLIPFSVIKPFRFYSDVIKYFFQFNVVKVVAATVFVFPFLLLAIYWFLRALGSVL